MKGDTLALAVLPLQITSHSFPSYFFSSSFSSVFFSRFSFLTSFFFSPFPFPFSCYFYFSLTSLSLILVIPTLRPTSVVVVVVVPFPQFSTPALVSSFFFSPHALSFCVFYSYFALTSLPLAPFLSLLLLFLFLLFSFLFPFHNFHLFNLSPFPSSSLTPIAFLLLYLLKLSSVLHLLNFLLSSSISFFFFLFLFGFSFSSCYFSLTGLALIVSSLLLFFLLRFLSFR